MPGFPGYRVSRGGEVRGRRGWVMTPEIDKDGYRRLCLRRDGRPYNRRVHMLVALAFLGDRPDGATVDHIDEVKTNNRASNLRWMSREDNARRSQRTRSLTSKQVAEIRRRAAGGESFTALAREFGRGVPTVWKIAHGQRYRHLGGPSPVRAPSVNR